MYKSYIGPLPKEQSVLANDLGLIGFVRSRNASECGSRLHEGFYKVYMKVPCMGSITGSLRDERVGLCFLVVKGLRDSGLTRGSESGVGGLGFGA